LRSLLLVLGLLLPTAARASEIPQPPAAEARHPTEAEQLLAAKRAEAKRQGRIQLARVCAAEKDILGWGKALFPDKFELPFCEELHGYFVSIRGEDFTNTEAPRGHAKTTIKCFLIPLFQALEEPGGPFRHYLNVQATAEKAIEINRAIKLELEENEELRAIYGDQVGGHKWTDKQFVLKNGVIFSALGANQSIRGIQYRNIRPDYIVVDDLYDEDEINNLEATVKRNKWFWGSLYKTRAIGRRTSIHLQGTAVNGSDLMEELKKRAGVKSRTFQAITDWETHAVLWPQANTFEQLDADRKLMGSVIFMREMQNERRDDATSIVKYAWLYPNGIEGPGSWEYDPDALVFNDDDLRLVGVILGFDPSIGATQKSDLSGVALVYEGRPTGATADGANYYIDGLWNERLSMDARIKLLEKIKSAQLEIGRPVTRANIEGIAGFKDFVAAARKTGLPIREVDQVKDKITTLENKSYYFENGRVFLNKNLPKELKDEVVYQLTTNKPKHDDVRDGVLLTLPARQRKPTLRVIA
jgi:hypothetical protein